MKLPAYQVTSGHITLDNSPVGHDPVVHIRIELKNRSNSNGRLVLMTISRPCYLPVTSVTI